MSECQKGIEALLHAGHGTSAAHSFELDALRHSKLMKGGQSVSDVVGLTEIVDQLGR